MKITIYELLGLIKDGKAPKMINIDGYTLRLIENETNWKLAYIDGYNDYLFVDYHLRLDDTLEILEEVEDKEYEFVNIDSYIGNVGRVDESNIEEYIHILFNQQSTLIQNQKKIIERLDK